MAQVSGSGDLRRSDRHNEPRRFVGSADPFRLDLPRRVQTMILRDSRPGTGGTERRGQRST